MRFIFNDVFTTDFKAPGAQTIDIGNFPVGTEITVEEVYSGSSYQLSGSNKTQKLTIQLNAEGTGVVDVLAEYINTYTTSLYLARASETITSETAAAGQEARR